MNQRRNWENSGGVERGQRREDRAFCDSDRRCSRIPKPEPHNIHGEFEAQGGARARPTNTTELKLEYRAPQQGCFPGQGHPAQPRSSSTARE